jgi:hypothetical protein
VIGKDARSFVSNNRVKHWIFSDSIIVIPDIDSRPLDLYSIDFFLSICASLMYRGITNRLPLRGAIGGGYFYKDDKILVSSALVDAHKYEQAQKWFGTVITPSALGIIHKFVPESSFGKPEGSPNAHRYIRKGVIPWKKEKKDKSENLSINDQEDFFYIIPPQMFPRDWTTYLPSYLDNSQETQKLIANSHRIYRVG